MWLSEFVSFLAWPYLCASKLMSMWLFQWVQSLSHVRLCDPMDRSMPGFPCPSPSPGACSNSCPSSQWCHPTISSSVVPFSSCLQSFPASRSFLTSQFFASGGQSIGASVSASVLPMNNTELVSFSIACFDVLAAQGTHSQESSPTPQFVSINSSTLSFLYGPALTAIHDCWKNHSFD